MRSKDGTSTGAICKANNPSAGIGASEKTL